MAALALRQATIQTAIWVGHVSAGHRGGRGRGSAGRVGGVREGHNCDFRLHECMILHPCGPTLGFPDNYLVQTHITYTYAPLTRAGVLTVCWAHTWWRGGHCSTVKVHTKCLLDRVMDHTVSCGVFVLCTSHCLQVYHLHIHSVSATVALYNSIDTKKNVYYSTHPVRQVSQSSAFTGGTTRVCCKPRGPRLAASLGDARACVHLAVKPEDPSTTTAVSRRAT